MLMMLFHYITILFITMIVSTDKEISIRDRFKDIRLDRR